MLWRPSGWTPTGKPTISSQQPIGWDIFGLLGDYIAGIVVRREARSGGVGRQLLDHVKTSRGQLRLQVYRKNLRAAAFYRREGFRVLEEGVDPETGEAELLMEWRWDGPQS